MYTLNTSFKHRSIWIDDESGKKEGEREREREREKEDTLVDSRENIRNKVHAFDVCRINGELKKATEHIQN